MKRIYQTKVEDSMIRKMSYWYNIIQKIDKQAFFNRKFFKKADYKRRMNHFFYYTFIGILNN